MAKPQDIKQGCGGCLVFVVLIGIAIYFAGSAREERAAAEKQRRALLTPEQQAAEDKAQQEAEEKTKVETQFELRKAEVQMISEDYVRKFLKHPNDASFGFWSIPKITWNQGRDTFFVSSTVKAKNDLGLELTYDWATIVTLDENTWKLVSCQIGDDVVYVNQDIANKLEVKKILSEQAALVAERKAKADAKRQHQAEIEKTYWRTWTSAGGKHTTEAKYSGVSSGVVTLTKKDGTVSKVPIEKLSESDRDWIKNHPR